MAKRPELDPLAKFHPVTFSLFLTLLSIVSCAVVRHAGGSGPPTGTPQDQMVLVSCVAPVTGGVSAVHPDKYAMKTSERTHVSTIASVELRAEFTLCRWRDGGGE